MRSAIPRNHLNINRLTAIDAWISLRAACYRGRRKMSTKIDKIEDMEDVFKMMTSFGLNSGEASELME